MARRAAGAEQAEHLVRMQERLMRRFLFQRRRFRRQDPPIPPQEVRVLFALADAGPSPMGKIARDLVVSVSSLTATIDRLVTRGLVERRPSQEDRRVVLVDLTAAGRRRYEEHHQGRLGMARAMLGALSLPEQRKFLELMRKIISQTSVALVLALALAMSAGCRSVRQARAVQDPAGRQPGERTVRLDELGLGTNAALTLDEAVRLAITNSPAVFQARASLAIAESQMQEARAAFLPQVTGAAGYERAKAYGHPAADNSYNAGRLAERA